MPPPASPERKTECLEEVLWGYDGDVHGAATALRLHPDRWQFKAAYGDLAYVTVEVVDAAGAVVKHAEPEVVLSVSGIGDLLSEAGGAVVLDSKELKSPWVLFFC